jgi:hypothetical protein
MKATKGRTKKNTRVINLVHPEEIELRFRLPSGLHLTPGNFSADKQGLDAALEKIREECCRTFQVKYPPKTTMVVQHLEHGRRVYGIVSGHYTLLDLEYKAAPAVPTQWLGVLEN